MLLGAPGTSGSWLRGAWSSGQGPGADLPPAEHEHGGALASRQEGGAGVVEVHGALGAEGHQGPRGLEGNLAGCNFLPQTISRELMEES